MNGHFGGLKAKEDAGPSSPSSTQTLKSYLLGWSVHVRGVALQDGPRDPQSSIFVWSGSELNLLYPSLRRYGSLGVSRGRIRSSTILIVPPDLAHPLSNHRLALVLSVSLFSPPCGESAHPETIAFVNAFPVALPFPSIPIRILQSCISGLRLLPFESPLGNLTCCQSSCLLPTWSSHRAGSRS